MKDNIASVCGATGIALIGAYILQRSFLLFAGYVLFVLGLVLASVEVEK